MKERSPDNPVDPALFSEAKWKAVQKARSTIAEKLTQNKNGTLSRDPQVMDDQLRRFEREIIELGWAVQGRESCRIL